MIKKYYFYFLFFLIVMTKLCSLSQSSCDNTCEASPRTLFLPLSITQNLYSQYHKYSQDLITLSVTYRFTQAYNDDQIIKSVLGDNPLVFIGEVGGAIDERPSNALVAEYFGMAPDTNFELNLNPQIRNQVIDVQLAMQSKNIWFQVNLPLVKPQWRINTNPINTMQLGTMPLQSEGNIYIYNVATVMNTETATLPPAQRTSVTDPAPVGYNVLPPQTAIKDITTYNGAYIFSPFDISAEGQKPFVTSDLNRGYLDVNDSLSSEFIVTQEFSEDNWVVGIGSWPVVSYTTCDYEASFTYTPSGGTSILTVPASLTESSTVIMDGNVTDLASQGSNVILITQQELRGANNIEDALDGSYNFNGLLNREYGNLKLVNDVSTQQWIIGDVILWLGYDFAFCDLYRIGMYLHGVVPTGTLIDRDWNRFAFTPVGGNGHHGQFGVGIAGAYVFCDNKWYTISCNINGYIDHVFTTKQFRIFDKLNQPMSRYAIVKALRYISGSIANNFNDDFSYQYLTTVGNVNGAELEISNACKGELIIDMTYDADCVSAGIGYAFSGLTADQLSCSLEKDNLTNNNFLINQMYYGYKGGDTAISSLIITNITANQKAVTAINECAVTGATPCSYPLASAFQNIPAGIFPSTVPVGNAILVKSCGDVTANGNSGAYSYGTSVGNGQSTGQGYEGTTEADVFSLPNISGNNSGLMGGQILNRLFAHFDFSWQSCYVPTCGFLGSYGFGSEKYFTPLYWDIGCYFSCSF